MSFTDVILISQRKGKKNRDDLYTKTKCIWNKENITILKTTVTAHGRQGWGSCELAVRCVTEEGSDMRHVTNRQMSPACCYIPLGLAGCGEWVWSPFRSTLRYSLTRCHLFLLILCISSQILKLRLSPSPLSSVLLPLPMEVGARWTGQWAQAWGRESGLRVLMLLWLIFLQVCERIDLLEVKLEVAEALGYNPWPCVQNATKVGLGQLLPCMQSRWPWEESQRHSRHQTWAFQNAALYYMAVWAADFNKEESELALSTLIPNGNMWKNKTVTMSDTTST